MKNIEKKKSDPKFNTTEVNDLQMFAMRYSDGWEDIENHMPGFLQCPTKYWDGIGPTPLYWMLTKDKNREIISCAFLDNGLDSEWEIISDNEDIENLMVQL